MCYFFRHYFHTLNLPPKMSINVVYNFSSSIHTSRENLRTVLAVINAILLMSAWRKRILSNYWICLLYDMKNYAIRGWGEGVISLVILSYPSQVQNLVLLYIHSKYLIYNLEACFIRSLLTLRWLDPVFL